MSSELLKQHCLTVADANVILTELHKLPHGQVRGLFDFVAGKVEQAARQYRQYEENSKIPPAPSIDGSNLDVGD